MACNQLGNAVGSATEAFYIRAWHVRQPSRRLHPRSPRLSTVN
jgi:hypothetical protein